VDWEEIAARRDELLVADVGDNQRRRATVTVYVVPEPSPSALVVAHVGHQQLAAPGGDLLPVDVGRAADGHLAQSPSIG